jgi:DnaJ-class molecular chaperone
MMGFFEDMLDDGMRTTQRIMRERQVSYEEARRLAVTECDECNGSGWVGHGMGGDTCGKCSGKGTT